MLAIMGLPTAGSQGGVPIVLSADTVDAENTLTIKLDDTTTPGFVTATIGDGVSSVQVWDFGDSITFVGTTETDGSVTNVVNFTTPYETALEGFGVFGGPLTPTEWNVWGRFGVSPTPLADVQVTLLYADELSAQAGSLGGPASTIAGDFQSPTAPPDGGSVVTLTSAVGISDALNVGISAYELTLEASNGAVAIDASIATTSDLLVSAVNAPLTLGGGARTVTSTGGNITIDNKVGPIVLDSTAFTASSGFVTVKTPNTLTVLNGSFTAPLAYDLATDAGLVHLEGLLGLVLPVTLPITAGRLELVTNSAAPIQLLGTSVASLQTDIQGDLSFASDVPLAITDFDPGTPSVQVTARNVTIQAEAGLRVVDGIDAAGTLCLTTWNGAGVPTVPVEFVVTSTGDNPAASASFAGTLRDMVEYANANTLLPAAVTAGVIVQPMRILFDEPGSPVAGAGVVTLQEALPALARAVTIDGTLPDGTFVAIGGGDTVSNGVTLGAGSSGSTVSNAAFHAFANAGVRVESAGNLLTGLILGEDGTGEASPNAIGIELYGSQAVRNTVGIRTLGVDDGNRIVANSIAGVMVRVGANYNTIAGNVIGIAGGDLGNFDGIAVLNSIGTIIGGSQSALANAISGNTRHGIRLTSVNGVAPAYGTLVIGNSIAANAVSGISIEGGSRNVIGGFTAAAANTITGNGIGVQMVSRGTVATKGNGVYGNAITDNAVGGVLIDQGSANLVQGNTITDSSEGTSVWGLRIYRSTIGVGVAANRVFQNLVSGHGDVADPDVAPLTGGIVVENASGQVIGGVGTLGNTVASNRGSGIVVVGGVGVNGASRNVVDGNYVGTNSSKEALGNAYDGIRIQGAVGTTVRANTVRGARGEALPAAVGISVHNALPASAALGNVIVSNAVSGSVTGVLVSGSRSTVVGGAVSGLGNWVFDNQQNGIEIRDSLATGASSGTVIRNNQVGLATRTTAAGNGGYGIDLQSTVGTIVDMGNTVANNTAGGIRVEGGRAITIGSAAGLGNAIWGNVGDGVEVTEPAEPARTEVVAVAGNAIRENGGYGVSVTGGRVSGVTIGRPVPVNRPTAASNTIVGNAFGGVVVDAAQAVSIVGNSIASNGGLGIQLVNGANAGVTAPVLTSAVPRVVGQRSPQYDVQGSIARTGGGTEQQVYFVDIYGTNTSTSRQVFLGRVVVPVRAGAASANFRVIVGAVGERYDRIVATATLGAGTSEFSTSINV